MTTNTMIYNVSYTPRPPEVPLLGSSSSRRPTAPDQSHSWSLGALGYEPQPWSSASNAVAPPSIGPRPTAPALEAQLQPWSP